MAVVALVVVALAGWSSGHPGHKAPVARFPDAGLLFRYPAAWARLDCREVTTLSSSIVYLTTVRPRPACMHTWGVWPAMQLGADDLAILWQDSSVDPGTVLKSSPGRNTRIGGKPARLAVMKPPARAVRLICGRIGGQRLILATINAYPKTAGQALRMYACLRGPYFGRNEAAVRQMLRTVRLSGL